MVFHHLHDFFRMGGYAPYVWSAYSVSFASIIGFSTYWLRQLHREKNTHA